ncbi:hypothetical protein [Streptomyces sp. G45]|uniref:hypothetical protein n=1 Tax=Streptomyces sp. G45 TaxID=3406627 RepID=UPI003C275305
MPRHPTPVATPRPGPAPGLPRRAVRAVGRGLREEWRTVGLGAWRALRERGAAGVALALLGVTAMVVLHRLQQTPASDDVIRAVGEVRADQPLWQSLLRTPVSVFVPTRDQPVWGGIPRLVLAFGLAQLLLGPARTLLVAYGATLAGTLSARALIALGPEWPGGLAPEHAHAVDTGASAAVVGLFAYLAVRLRAPVLCLATVVPTVIGSLLKPNLAGREHLVAVAVVVAVALVREWRRPGRFRRSPGPPTATARAADG